MRSNLVQWYPRVPITRLETEIRTPIGIFSGAWEGLVDVKTSSSGRTLSNNTSYDLMRPLTSEEFEPQDCADKRTNKQAFAGFI